MRGAFLLPDLEAMQKVWAAAPASEFWPKVFEKQPAPLVLVVWESGRMDSEEFGRHCDFLALVASLACAGFALARMGEEVHWFDISGKVLYPRPVVNERIARAENLLPMDENYVWEYATESKGAKDKLGVAYEQFDLGGGSIYCVRPDSGPLCPAFFIHWANYHFVETGKWLNLEVEETQLAPDYSTYNRAEPILDLSGKDLTPRVYVNEGERFFQVHTPEWTDPVNVPAGNFAKVMKVRVDFYGIQPDGDAVWEKVFWYLAPGIGLVKMESDQGTIHLERIPHFFKKRRFLWRR